MHNRPKQCTFTQTLRNNRNNANVNPPPQDPTALPRAMIQYASRPCALRSAPKPTANYDVLQKHTGALAFRKHPIPRYKFILCKGHADTYLTAHAYLAHLAPHNQHSVCTHIRFQAISWITAPEKCSHLQTRTGPPPCASPRNRATTITVRQQPNQMHTASRPRSDLSLRPSRKQSETELNSVSLE